MYLMIVFLHYGFDCCSGWYTYESPAIMERKANSNEVEVLCGWILLHCGYKLLYILFLPTILMHSYIILAHAL